MADAPNTEAPSAGAHSASPVAIRDHSDPGDATARNYRYQHTYGVILLAGAHRKLSPYVALWCEHHEDFLAEAPNEKFTAFQIKTSRPENGAWRLTDPEMVKSIGRFGELISKFGDAIEKVVFVTNTDWDKVGSGVQDQRRRARCPQLMLDHIAQCTSPTAIQEPFLTAFNDLQAECGCSPSLIFSALSRMSLVLGPSRPDMDASLAHEHIGRLPECSGLAPRALDEICNRLVSLIYRASSMQVTAAERHLPTARDATLDAKRIELAAFAELLANTDARPTFKFLGDASLALGEQKPSTTLQKKMSKGGIDADDIEVMKERERAAEYSLMEDMARRPDEFPTLLRQIEQRVLGICRDAHLATRNDTQDYGPQMLALVQSEVREVAQRHAPDIGNHQYECLMGVAGLLTTACRVWWSPRFDLTEGEK